jgi:hypothetical protein
MAAELFGLIHGNVSRWFSHGHLPDTSFLYIAQGIVDTSGGNRALIESQRVSRHETESSPPGPADSLALNELRPQCFIHRPNRRSIGAATHLTC